LNQSGNHPTDEATGRGRNPFGGLGSQPNWKRTALWHSAQSPDKRTRGRKYRAMQNNNIAKIVSKQRQLVAGMELADQIATLDSLVNNPPQNSRVVQFSPELAEFILKEKNLGNRAQKVRQIRRYSEDMSHDNWSLTGQPIVFGNHGNLLDGQNRLAACVKANVPFTTHAVFGVEPKSFVHFDIGKNRNATDVFTIMGVKYARETGLVVRLFTAWQNGHAGSGNTLMSNDELRKAYNTMDTEMLELAIKKAKRVNEMTDYPVSHLATLFYCTAMNGDIELVKNFMDDMAARFGKGVRSPVRALLENVGRMKMDKTQKITSAMFSIMLARTWNNYKIGRASVKSDFNIRIDTPMPNLV